jgi:hypothetical protein
MAASIFCLGDVHGDLLSMVAALEGNGVIDNEGVWVAGTATLIQMGDMLDAKARNVPQFYGGEDIDVLRFLKNLRTQARASGGDVRCLFGNHELMNMAGVFAYVRDNDMCGREKLFSPNGEGTQLIYDLCELIIIKDNILFCHAGLHPHIFEEHSASKEALLASLMRSVVGDAVDIITHPLVGGEDGITTTRYYMELEGQDYDSVSRLLNNVGCDRMVIGHNCVSKNISTRCRGRVVLVDVGISRAFHTTPASTMLAVDTHGCLWEVDGEAVNPV